LFVFLFEGDYRLFEKLDTDNDGVVTQKEWILFLDTVRKEKGEDNAFKWLMRLMYTFSLTIGGGLDEILKKQMAEVHKLKGQAVGKAKNKAATAAEAAATAAEATAKAEAAAEAAYAEIQAEKAGFREKLRSAGHYAADAARTEAQVDAALEALESEEEELRRAEAQLEQNLWDAEQAREKADHAKIKAAELREAHQAEAEAALEEVRVQGDTAQQAAAEKHASEASREASDAASEADVLSSEAEVALSGVDVVRGRRDLTEARIAFEGKESSAVWGSRDSKIKAAYRREKIVLEEAYEAIEALAPSIHKDAELYRFGAKSRHHEVRWESLRAYEDHRGVEESLRQSCQDGCLDECRYLLRKAWPKGANVNAAGTGGKTPLHYAAFGGHLDLVDLLLGRFGAWAGARTEWGFTAEVLAMQEGHHAVANRLLAARLEASFEEEEEGRESPGFNPVVRWDGKVRSPGPRSPSISDIYQELVSLSPARSLLPSPPGSASPVPPLLIVDPALFPAWDPNMTPVPKEGGPTPSIAAKLRAKGGSGLEKKKETLARLTEVTKAGTGAETCAQEQAHGGPKEESADGMHDFPVGRAVTNHPLGRYARVLDIRETMKTGIPTGSCSAFLPLTGNVEAIRAAADAAESTKVEEITLPGPTPGGSRGVAEDKEDDGEVPDVEELERRRQERLRAMVNPSFLPTYAVSTGGCRRYRGVAV